MEEQFGFADASALVFASGLPNQMLTNALNRQEIAAALQFGNVRKNGQDLNGAFFSIEKA